MNRFKNYVLTAAGFAVLAMTVGVFTAGHAIAQAVRAALVSNVDEPGRIPYQNTLDRVNCDGSCTISFPPVPVGKRLVITNVSGHVITNVPEGTVIEPQLEARTVQVFSTTTYQGSFLGRNTFVFNHQTQLTYDAGDAPTVFVLVEASGFTTATVATLMGYLLDCSAGPCAAIP